jgi:hypothetical protein
MWSVPRYHKTDKLGADVSQSVKRTVEDSNRISPEYKLTANLPRPIPLLIKSYSTKEEYKFNQTHSWYWH